MKPVLNAIVFSLLLTPALGAGKERKIAFQGGGFHYKAGISKEKAWIKGYLIDLSAQKRECSALALETLHKKINKELRNKVLTKDRKKGYRVKIDGKETLLLKGSPLASYLYHLPVVFKRLKYRESVLCD